MVVAITTSMRSKKDIARLAGTVGATVEEDAGIRTLRCLQLVAPAGMVWVDGRSRCIRLNWAGGSAQAANHNEAEYRLAAEIIRCGLAPMDA